MTLNPPISTGSDVRRRLVCGDMHVTANRQRRPNRRSTLERKSLLPIALLVVCNLSVTGCAEERAAVDITFALSTNAVSLADIMDQTESITLRIDTESGSSSLPYPATARCGPEPDDPRRCSAMAAEGSIDIQIHDPDLDGGHELTATFTDVQRDLSMIRLEQGGLPSTRLRIFIMGSVGYGAAGQLQAQRVTFRHADDYVDLSPFAGPPNAQMVALKTAEDLIPPRVVSVTPNEEELEEAVPCETADFFIEFSRLVRREDALEHVRIEQIIDDVPTPVEFRLGAHSESGEFTKLYNLRSAEDGRPFFQYPVTDPPTIHFHVTVETGVQDEQGNQLDQYPQQEGLQPYTVTWAFECSPVGIDSPNACGSGLPPEGCGVGSAYTCMDGRCVRTSCVGVECGQGEVCSERHYACVPDCRERGGALFCLPGEVCDEGGFCR